jgi:hypothetical protein
MAALAGEPHMTSIAQKLAGRVAIAVLLVMLAVGSVFAVVATLPATAGPALGAPPENVALRAKDSPAGDEEKAARKSADEDADDSPDIEKAEQADEADGAPSPENLERIVERLAAAGITTTVDELAALADKVGVGGAVRVLRFAQASGKTSVEILALFDSGKGWGVIARELELQIGPGLGPVMGKGNGRDEASKAADRAARAAERARQGAGSGD